MKKIILLVVYFSPLLIKAQNIYSFAGNGIPGSTLSGGLANTTSIGAPDGCAFDFNGNFYFTQVGSNKVCKVNTDGIISCIAGTGVAGYNGDSIAATEAEINNADGLAIDKQNNIYIADTYNNRIRKIDALTGIISTIAGNGTAGYGGDGYIDTASLLNGPTDVCFDLKGNLYISDANNHRVRKIDTNGIITTIAGTGIEGSTGDGGPATSAKLWLIAGICSDRIGNIYISQFVETFTVRKIDTSGFITTVAGNGTAGNTGDGGPATAAEITLCGLACDNSGYLYIAGYGSNNVRIVNTNGIINTIAGTSVAGYSGDGGPADSAKLNSPYGIVLDTCGNIYVADKDNYRIRKIAMNPYCWPEGVNNVSESNEVKVYPNPASNEITIATSPGLSEGEVTLYNMFGEVVYDKAFVQQKKITIDISSLPDGVYFVKVNPASGGTYVEKVVKE